MDYCSEVTFRCIFQVIFERFDPDRSGRIDSSELCDAFLSLDILSLQRKSFFLGARWSSSGVHDRWDDQHQGNLCCSANSLLHFLCVQTS